jgi:DNA recombination protein RmuC
MPPKENTMIWFGAGIIVGLILGVIITLTVKATSRSQQEKQLAETSEQLRNAFASLAVDALDANSKRLGEQTAATLDTKKQLIDKSLEMINDRLNRLGEFVKKTEADRRESVGNLNQSITSLSATTGELHKVLASTQRRGAWGERMADDILRLVGLVEKVNYTKQSGAEAESGRPDFTFFLPNDLKVNMDVKFPLDAYRAYLDADDDAGRAAHLKALGAAMKNHIRAVAGRGYIDPKAPTVDYVILFVASEQILSLVLSDQPDLIDEALSKKIVLTGPMSLYAMLAVIRQVAEHASIMDTADEVISLLAAFNKQWQNFREQMDKVGQRLTQTQSEFDTLCSTRTNMLQRPIDKIEDLRNQRGIDVEEL